MAQEQHQRVSELFFEVCDLDPEECSRVLDKSCADDPDVRSQVEALLRQDRKQAEASLTEIVERGAQDATVGFVDKHRLAPTDLGPYTIVKEIGEGGMSVVYEAQQTEPVKRQVALKVIRPGMDTREVITRFESERQALAVMDHPNIAKIFDGGASANGRPYFVMELVDGEPVTRYCDDRLLAIRARLKLFLDVCAAIQHAHQKGVVHRDLKPSNILIAEHDDKPVPKVIDFGIAKAVDATLSDDPLVTRLGQLVGTPGYMSPEQAMARGAEIDTRTDVYSLGVVLYQLVVGALPHDIGDLSAREIRELARETTAPRPSTRLSQLGDRQASSLARRATDLGTLRRTLSDGLDWIVLKAMEKEPQRRYQSVGELAADVENFLAHRPVTARPPSTGYVVGQFVRRNRKTVGVVAAIVLALLGGITLATVGLIRATNAERIATREAEKSKATMNVMVELIQEVDPYEGEGEDLLVSEFFERNVERVQRLDTDPEVQATLLHTFGIGLRHLGEVDEAGAVLKQALEQRLMALPPDSPDVADTMAELGEYLRIRGDFDAARDNHEKALAIRRQLYGDSHVMVGRSIVGLGQVAVGEGDYDVAEGHLRQGLAIFRDQGALTDDVKKDLANTLNDLAIVMEQKSDLTAAELLHREALVMRREVRGETHPDIASTLNNLGAVLSKRGKLEEAEAAYRDALSIREQALGDLHPRVGVTLNNLGLLLRKKGDYEAAEPLYRRSLDIRRQTFGAEHESVATGLNNLAGLLRAKGDLPGAERNYRESLAVRIAVQGEAHPYTALTRVNLASVLNDQARYTESCAQVDAAMPIIVGALKEGHWRVAVGRSVRGGCLAGLGEYEQAEGLLIDSLAAIRANRGDDAIYTKRAVERLIALYGLWGKPERTEHYQSLLASISGAG